MFKGPYGFFDYKYNIAGYEGQDYSGTGRLIYIIAAAVIVVLLLILLRNAKKETVKKYLKIVGIAFVSAYIIKTTWESYFDITVDGGFNLYILPFDTCSVVMWACLLAGFGTPKLQKLGACWLVTGSMVGSIGAIPFLTALKYYPFFTFGAFYSMLWHIVMLFTGAWLIVTNYVEMNFKTLLTGFAFHILVSLVVIPLDYIFSWDFMFYRTAGSVPIIEGVSEKLAANGMGFFTTPIMIAAYFITFAVIIYGSLGLKKLFGLFKKKHATAE